jgi:hypothetical protein
MKIKLVLSVLNVAIALCLLASIGSTATAFAQGKPSGAQQGATKPKTMPKVVYRELDPAKDGFDCTFTISARFKEDNSGKRIGTSTIDGLNCSNTAGQGIDVNLVSPSAHTFGRVEIADLSTVDFGVMRIKYLPATDDRGAVILVTNEQARQIRKKIDEAAGR